MSNWTNMEAAGFLPVILRDSDPRPVAEQLNDRYAHGGGFRTFGKAQWKLDKDSTVNGKPVAMLTYPNDPPMRELSRCQLNDELCILFEGSWLAVVQPDQSFVVTRVD